METKDRFEQWRKRSREFDGMLLFVGLANAAALFIALLAGAYGFGGGLRLQMSTVFWGLGLGGAVLALGGSCLLAGLAEPEVRATPKEKSIALTSVALGLASGAMFIAGGIGVYIQSLAALV